jgi:hypothetical protein
MRRFLAGVVAALSAEATLALVILCLGLAPVAADQPPSTLEARILGAALHKAAFNERAESRSRRRPRMKTW